MSGGVNEFFTFLFEDAISKRPSSSTERFANFLTAA